MAIPAAASKVAESVSVVFVDACVAFDVMAGKSAGVRRTGAGYDFA